LAEVEIELIDKSKGLGTPGTLLDACIKDAFTRFILPKKGIPEHIPISHYSWTQMWRKVPPDQNLELVESIQGGRIILAPTIIVESNLNFDVCVYHAGEFAYYIKKPNNLFVKDLTERKLMGAEEYHRRLKPYDAKFSNHLVTEAMGRTIN
jgi:hypothetical protein